MQKCKAVVQGVVAAVQWARARKRLWGAILGATASVYWYMGDHATAQHIAAVAAMLGFAGFEPHDKALQERAEK